MSWGEVHPGDLGIGAQWNLAESLLADALPRRWSHSKGVCYRAASVGPHVARGAELLLLQAAILHDIGYSPELVQTGFHPLDGARYLRSVGVDERVVSLVAHHSCARVEAELRGLARELDEFAPSSPDLTDAMIFCDMTVSPDGLPVSVEARISEVIGRYGSESVVGRFMRLAGPELRAATARVDQRLAHAGADRVAPRHTAAPPR